MCFMEIVFSIVFFVKPYGDGEMANRYRLKALVVTSHGQLKQLSRFIQGRTVCSTDLRGN